MPEVEDFLPIFPEETEETVLDRLLIWLNEDVPTGDPTWIDPREGGMARTLLVPAAREMAILYDRISVELPAAASPLFAWGVYLDQWALSLGTERKPATSATGTVTFTAVAETVIAAGLEVGVEPSVALEEPSFLTQDDVTVPGTAPATGTVSVAIEASEPGVIGNVPTGAVTAILSAPPEPDATVTNAAPTTGGTDEETDEELRARVLAIYAATPGGGNVADYVQWVSALPGVGRVSVSPEVAGPGTVGISAMAPNGDPVSDTTNRAIRQYLDPPAAEQTISSVAAGRITVPSTTGFRAEGGLLHRGSMLGAEKMYQYTSVTATTFEGVTPTPPTFTAGDKVWQGGRGGGRAPIGHHVLVTPQTWFNVNINPGQVVMDPGYTLDDLSEGINIRDQIVAAMRGYVDVLPAAAEIVYSRLVGVVVAVQGVHDVADFRVNGFEANITAPAGQVPTLNTINLTAL